jgi:hypothetical protein
MVLPPNQSLPVVPEQQFIVKPLVKAIEKEYEKFNTGSVILKPKPVILEIFSQMTDPRIDRKKRHILSEIIVLAMALWEFAGYKFNSKTIGCAPSFTFCASINFG